MLHELPKCRPWAMKGSQELTPYSTHRPEQHNRVVSLLDVCCADPVLPCLSKHWMGKASRALLRLG
jgi:hypothetical protein